MVESTYSNYNVIGRMHLDVKNVKEEAKKNKQELLEENLNLDAVPCHQIISEVTQGELQNHKDGLAHLLKIFSEIKKLGNPVKFE